MNLKEATKTKACSNCKHCKRIPKHIIRHCEKHNAKMGYVWVVGMRCDDWKEDEE